MRYFRLLTLFLFISTLIVGCGDDNKRGLTNPTEYDPYFKYQWYLSYDNNPLTEAFRILPDASIHIKKAWEITKGAGVKVAIIDSNFNLKESDIQHNIVSYYNADTDSLEVLNTSEELSHGTACAGYIAAAQNDFGIEGSAPEAELILIVQEYVDDAATIRAFEFAKNAGAKVISNSWGTNDVSEAVAAELADLKEQNITIFFASGNENMNLDIPGINDESELESVIGVGATNEYNQITEYSNYGAAIDILAPGGESLGLLGIGANENGTTTYTLPDRSELTLDAHYTFNKGTSFSCPLSAGVAALMLSINPSLTPDQIKEILLKSGDENNLYNVYDQRVDTLYHYKKVNAEKAVAMAKNFH